MVNSKPFSGSNFFNRKATNTARWKLKEDMNVVAKSQNLVALYEQKLPPPKYRELQSFGDAQYGTEKENPPLLPNEKL